MSDDIYNPLARESQEKSNPEPANASALDDSQKANISFANNAIILKDKSEEIFTGPDNTLISLGRDRPAEIGTGKQYDLAGAIYICAGASQGIKNKTPTNNFGQTQKANRNFNLDASSIYMTAKGDIDRYYGLAPGGMGNATDSAAIAIKSTNLRFVARSGIKLVTGTDLTNENLSKMGSFVGVELIAGNDSSDMQPIVKGKNLVKAFNELTFRIEKIIATMEYFATVQSKFDKTLAKHTHPDMLNMLIGLVVAGDVDILTDGRSLLDEETDVVGSFTSGAIDETVMKHCSTHRQKLVDWKKKYLGGTEKEDINSRYHKVN